jgi:integrase
MSGGLYGRGKAPERTCLKLKDWPNRDRQIWEKACEAQDILSLDAGLRANHAPISNYKTQQGYGRWLTFLHLNDRQALSLEAADRITPKRVVLYVQCLQQLNNSTQTIMSRLQELCDAARIFDQNRKWAFINEISAKIRARHKPARSKTHIKLSDELVDLGKNLMDQARSADKLDAAILHRDGLIISLTAYIPFRRRNIADIKIGENLILVGGIYRLILSEYETKTHNPLELYVPEDLIEPLDIYLQKYRPYLKSRTGRWAKPITQELWVSKDGSPMTEIAIYDRIRIRTQETFDAPMSPHLFRDAAATFLAIADPEHVRIAAPLLGHRTFSTTERYYQQANAMEAHRQFVEVMRNMGGDQNDNQEK